MIAKILIYGYNNIEFAFVCCGDGRIGEILRFANNTRMVYLCEDWTLDARVRCGEICGAYYLFEMIYPRAVKQ